jgi:uncharacterized membrane protein
MIDGFLFVLTLVTAVACALVAGFFFAFSTTVMRSLARLPAEQGIAAMQSINVVVINPLVMTALFGTALACVVLEVAAFVEWGEAYSVYLLLGGLLYIAGVVVLTMAYHVPRNDALDTVDPNGSDAATTGTATSGRGRHGTTCELLRRWRPRRSSPSRCVSAEPVVYFRFRPYISSERCSIVASLEPSA